MKSFYRCANPRCEGYNKDLGRFILGNSSNVICTLCLKKAIPYDSRDYLSPVIPKREISGSDPVFGRKVEDKFEPYQCVSCYDVGHKFNNELQICLNCYAYFHEKCLDAYNKQHNCPFCDSRRISYLVSQEFSQEF